MNVVLAGTPNAGKTTLFNALTHSSLKTGNFHGVTTECVSKTTDGITYTDVPGAYSFSAYSMEEKEALGQIISADIIINVVDACALPSSLAFTRNLIAKNRRTVVYLTKVQKLKRRGGKIDQDLLSQYLGAPVLTCPPNRLKEYIKAGPKPVPQNKNIALNKAYYGGNCNISPADKLFYNNIFSALFFVAAITFMFFLAFHPAMPGAKLKELTEFLLCRKLCTAITSKMSNAPAISFIQEGIFGGVGGVLSFIPQLAVLYTVLTLLDESGIMSALTFTTDGLFSRANLSGRAAFSLISGFGCTAAAILTTRGYSTPLAQKRTIAVLPFIPCSAKLPVFLTFLSPLFSNPFPVITCLYFLGVLAAFACSALMGKGGESMLSEIVPVEFPSLKRSFIKLCFYLKGFIIKVTGPVALFCVANWLLSHFSFGLRYVGCEGSILAVLSRAVLPLFMPMGIRDWRIAYAALCGFIAKENIAATVSMLCPGGPNLAMAPAVGMCVFVLFCPACISAFSASCKEAGLKFTLKCFAAQLAAAFASGYAVSFILRIL